MKRSLLVLLLALVSLCLVLVLNVQAQPSTDRTVSVPPAAGCGAVSCTTYLPLLYKSTPGIPPQFEVTQGVQQPNNSVLLVADRPTFVRWTLTAGTVYTNVNAVLYGWRDGVPLPGSPIGSLNNPRTLKATADRATLNDTFNFQIPGSWRRGTILLSARASNAAGFSASTTSAAFQFRSSATLAIKPVPIEYHCTNDTAVTLPGDPPYSYLTSFTYRVYPVPSLSFSSHAAIRYDGPCGNNLPQPDFTDWDNMLGLVTDVWLAEGSPDIYYYGLIKIDCSSFCVSGLGWVGWPVAIGFDGFGTAHSGASETHAHEVGHNHGRPHAPGCGATGQGFPYVPVDGKARIGDNAHQNYGFNLDTQAIYNYAAHYDMMSYCDPAWVSDFTYQALWDFANTRRSFAGPVVNDRAWLISGSINPRTDQVKFDPAYAIDLPARWSAGGDYVLEMLNDLGRVVAAYPFTPMQAQPDRVNQGVVNAPVVGFHLALPYRDDVTMLRVRHGAAILGSLTAASSTPVVRPTVRSAQLSPAGRISWSGADASGQPLYYLVRASTDRGQTWQVIGVDLSVPAITLRTDDFGGQTVQLQVTGSNGLRSSTLALGPYSVPGK